MGSGAASWHKVAGMPGVHRLSVPSGPDAPSVKRAGLLWLQLHTCHLQHRHVQVLVLGSSSFSIPVWCGSWQRIVSQRPVLLGAAAAAAACRCRAPRAQRTAPHACDRSTQPHTDDCTAGGRSIAPPGSRPGTSLACQVPEAATGRSSWQAAISSSHDGSTTAATASSAQLSHPDVQ